MRVLGPLQMLQVSLLVGLRRQRAKGLASRIVERLDRAVAAVVLKRLLRGSADQQAVVFEEISGAVKERYEVVRPRFEDGLERCWQTL